MKLKKMITGVIATAMVLSVSTTVFAASEQVEFNFTKSYVDNTGAAPAVIPGENLTFQVTAAEGNPDGTTISIADQTITSNPQNIVVTIPATYSKVGKYNYTVKELTGNTQGVTYSENEFGVQVLVTNDTDGDGLLETNVVFTTSDGKEGKINGIVNTYNLGSLTVSKMVSGNLASSTQTFDIDVTFKVTDEKVVRSAISYGGDKTIGVEEWKNGSVTKTISLSNGQDVTFSNIPAGVTYTVTEQNKHSKEDTNGSDPAKGYTVSYTKSDDSSVISAGDVDTVEVKNEKKTEVDTGINLDSLPYIMILAVVAIALVAFFGKKRMARNN